MRKLSVYTKYREGPSKEPDVYDIPDDWGHEEIEEFMVETYFQEAMLNEGWRGYEYVIEDDPDE